ncbi:MAG TPA: LytTR family DNA-binding domain-containing protein [Euzebyales bacterium]
MTPDDRSRRRARCLIVDDEAPAREELRYLLQSFPDVQVVGEATNAEEAAVLLDSVDYDVVLLDIRMPGGTGLELATRLREQNHQAAVVFTTAYPDHAVEAFDLAAADYLVKPFDAERLGRALRRALGSAGSDEDDPPPRRHDGDDLPPALATRVPIQHGGRTVLVESDDIYYATASRGYSYIKLADDRVLTTYTLADLERRLTGFFRCHRSHLVNLSHVRELVSDYQGGLVLVIDDRQRSRVEVSRRQAAALRRALGV